MIMQDRELKAYLHYGGPFTDNQPCPRLTTETKCYWNTLEWQRAGIEKFPTGYGRKIPTPYMVMHNNRLKRVYCCNYGNSGTLYILQNREPVATVDIYNVD